MACLNVFVRNASTLLVCRDNEAKGNERRKKPTESAQSTPIQAAEYQAGVGFQAKS
jgi:hypothetical protein